MKLTEWERDDALTLIVEIAERIEIEGLLLSAHSADFTRAPWRRASGECAYEDKQMRLFHLHC